MNIVFRALPFLFLLFFAQCKKQTEPEKQNQVTFFLYDQQPAIVQSHIEGNWKVEYGTGGATGGYFPFTGKQNYVFKGNRMTILNNDVVYIDTTMSWYWNGGITPLGDSTFIMNYKDKSGFQYDIVLYGIIKDSLLLSDYGADVVMYHCSKLNP
jgi:hypothetical protein